jgi:TonB family protein
VAALASGPVTVKFAVYPGGKVERVQVISPVADPRIGEAVVRAVRACEWVAGSDAEGNPTALWVVQPVRFAG